MGFTPSFRCESSETSQRTIAAKVRIAKRLFRESHGFEKTHQQSIVRDFRELKGLSHLEA